VYSFGNYPSATGDDRYSLKDSFDFLGKNYDSRWNYPSKTGLHRDSLKDYSCPLGKNYNSGGNSLSGQGIGFS